MGIESTCDSPEPNQDLYELDEDELRDLVQTMRETRESLELKIEGLQRAKLSLYGKLERRDKKISALQKAQEQKVHPFDLDAILDWAWRDQDECRQCSTTKDEEKEAKQNLKLIEKARKILIKEK